MAQSTVRLPDAGATAAEGARLAGALLSLRPPRLIVYLEGELGAGKTTFARGFLRALGHQGRVPSPTYTLVEPYELSGYRVYHVDLYRIRDPRELANLGLGEELERGSAALIEWPGLGVGHLPPPDVRAQLALAADERVLTVVATSELGDRVLGQTGAAKT